MKKLLLLVIAIAFCLTTVSGQGKILTTDPLTNLPLIPATDSGNGFGNSPTPMPKGTVCGSKMEAEFYSLYKIKASAAVDWYSSHLTGFKHVHGAISRTQDGFYNSDGTILVIVTGNSAVSDTDAYSVAYERYQPGLPEKTIASLTQNKIVCK